MDWIRQHWQELAPLVLMAGGVWWLMPQLRPRPKAVGLLCALVGTGWLATRLGRLEGPMEELVTFSIFASAAIVCAILMITNRNPVYSALWFALATLSTCGLYLLQYAAFLAAATVVIYAGAIVVTFLFVIMLAQQSGATDYDQRSRQPLLATLAAFLLLAALMGTLRATSGEMFSVSQGRGAAASANPFSQPTADERLGTLRGLGRSMFSDYLFAVELAGTLLLVASIGAIAIAPRRRGGTL